MKISESNRRDIPRYAAEFEKKYLLEPAGQKHLSRYKTEKEEVKRLWNEAKTSNAQGNLSADFVLEKLLPYANTQHNREKGYLISIAPAITKDLKLFFQNSPRLGARPQQSKVWDSVAKAIFDLFYSVVENDDWDSLCRFEQNKELSLGFKTGYITPTLHFLKPECRIINNKTIDTVNFILDKRAIGRDLSRYREYLGIIDETVKELGIPIFQDHADVFDAFCHWMCDKRLGGYARMEKGIKPTEEDEEGPTAIDEGTDEESVPNNHWEAIYYLVKTGNLLGFKTYVADPSREAFGKQLKEVASLTEVPPILMSAREIARVDVIWYRPAPKTGEKRSLPPIFLFEVEDGGTMRDALLRLFNAMAFDAQFFVVSPADNRPKFGKWVTTAPFKEYEGKYNFRTYTELFDFYKQSDKFTSMQGHFFNI